MLYKYCAFLLFAAVSIRALSAQAPPADEVPTNTPLSQEILEEMAFNKAAELCRYCHKFSDAQLARQAKRARRRHLKVREQNRHCFGCHDIEELEDICCHN